MEKRSLPEFPKDDVLAHLLSSFPEMAYKYHIHDSLLENTEETELTEEEKVEAWRKFEGDEKSMYRIRIYQIKILKNIRCLFSRSELERFISTTTVVFEYEHCGH